MKRSSAVVVLGHGSRVAAANGPLAEVAALASGKLGGVPTVAAFLQLARPTLAEAVEDLYSRGARDIRVVPFFLYPGAHVVDDIPAELENLRARYPDAAFTLTGHLGVHPLMADIVASLAGADLNSNGRTNGR